MVKFLPSVHDPHAWVLPYMPDQIIHLHQGIRIECQRQWWRKTGEYHLFLSLFG